MAESAEKLCVVCQVRDGTNNRVGLTPNAGSQQGPDGARYAFFTCQSCGQEWLLVGGAGSGASPHLIRGSRRS